MTGILSGGQGVHAQVVGLEMVASIISLDRSMTTRIRTSQKNNMVNLRYGFRRLNPCFQPEKSKEDIKRQYH